MSVLIRDMKKPEKCGVCPMRGYSLCPLTKKEVLWNLLDDDCPLIEVSEDVQPVKHGRWIDGDYHCVTAVCSKCKHLRLGNGAKFATRIALYCEHCGARMDGES